MTTRRAHVPGEPAHPRQAIYDPEAWHRDHRFGLAGIVAATGLTLLVGFLGPSVVTLPLERPEVAAPPPTRGLPPYYLPDALLDPHEWLVTVLTWGLLVVGAGGLWICMRALAGGWHPRVRRLFALGSGLSLATILVPPLTSADVLMYAAYGRLQVLGQDPYDITPAQVFRGQFDPVLSLTERPWTDTPSVYGPITSWLQLLANRLGGEVMHDIVFWLQLTAVVPFLVACAFVVRMAGVDRRRQGRAVVLTVCNPMLIWGVVAGAHNEALAVMFAVIGMTFLRRSPFLAGIGIGLAGCAKLSIGLWGLAMLWAYRHEPRKALMLCLGTAVPMGLAYVVWQPAAFVQVLRNGGYVSVGSWAQPVFLLFHAVTGDPFWATLLTGVLSYTGLILICWMLSRVLPWTAAPGLHRGADPRHDPLTVALRTALILSVGWLVTAMYTLSWYDLIAWIPLALLAASKLDRILLLRILLLSMAFVPGRAVDLGPALDFVALRVRDTLSPIVQFGVLLALVLWWRRPNRPEVLPLRRRPAARDPATRPAPTLVSP